MGRLIDIDNIEYYLEEGGSVVAFKADIEQIPTADIDTDSAYAEGWTAAESKYRAMMSDGDCISRQAAIDEIDEWIKAFRENGHKESAADARLIQDGIIQLPSAQPEPQWIPCSERLPEEYGEYRITWTTSASKKRFIGDSEYEITGEWDSENYRFNGEWLLDDYIKNYPDVKVLAWKPLEEPWRGEQE